MRVLIVDDEPALRAGVAALLAESGIEGVPAATAAEADTCVRTSHYAAIILDLGLPDGHGLTLLRRWRRRGVDCPILVLSAHGAPDERADGIQAGADDYLGKPYHARELAARIQRLLYGARPAAECIPLGAAGEWRLDPANGAVEGPEGPLSLSPTLRRVLMALAAAGPRPLSKEQLLDQVTDQLDPASENAVEQWIARLRSRLGADVIVTDAGLGYRLQRPRP